MTDDEEEVVPEDQNPHTAELLLYSIPKSEKRYIPEYTLLSDESRKKFRKALGAKKDSDLIVLALLGKKYECLTDVAEATFEIVQDMTPDFYDDLSNIGKVVMYRLVELNMELIGLLDTKPTTLYINKSKYKREILAMRIISMDY